MKRRHFLAVSLGLVPGVRLAAQERIIVCSRCGWEIPPRARFCANCGHPSPVAPDEPEPEPEEPLPEPEPEEAATDERIASHLRAARSLADAEPAVALLLLRNTRALNALTEASRDQAAEIDRLLAAVEGRIKTRSRTCPICEGRGHSRILAINMAGEVREVEVPSRPCAGCGGQRQVSAVTTLPQLRQMMGPAQRRMEELLTAQDHVLDSGIWVRPEETARNLGVDQVIALRTAYRPPCRECHGQAMLGCEPCQGMGVRVCTATGCRGGHRVCPDCRGTRSSRVTEGGRTIVRMCRTCAGLGHAPCDVCRGQGLVPCATCERRGETTCRVCDGSGSAPECTTCRGSGGTECRACRGSGVQRDAPCPTCRGGGHTLCTRCNGFGRAVR